MLNQVILVGRLVRTPELQLSESGKKMSFITLAVSRSYKNQNGEYDTDFFDCTLWTGIAESTSEYCKSGDIIGLKGRLQTRLIENEDGTRYKKMEIIAEKVTFLSSARTDKNSNEKENVIGEDNDSDDENETDNVVDYTDGEATEVSVVKESGRKYNRKKK